MQCDGSHLQHVFDFVGLASRIIDQVIGLREIYLVRPELWSSLAIETMFSPRLLVTAINRQDVVFLWPVKLPGPDGRMDE